MTKEERIALLKDNPVFWSRLGFCYDPPLKNEKGLPLVFTEDLSKYGKYHNDFSKAGVHIHTCILHAGWMGVDEYDYSLTDRVLDEIFLSDPDGYFIPRIKLNVPIDWCFENPEEVFVYPEGPTDKGAIRALVGTEKQDYIGYEAPNGYYMAGDFVDTRPNVGGVIARQSFASKKWLADATVALEKLIDRLENGKYGDRILGYHIAYGASGECVFWGRMSEHYGDYGICARRAFFDWGIRKYGSRAALADAWCQTADVTWETLRLPTPEERYTVKASVDGFFRGAKAQTISNDLDIFHSEINCDAIEHFGKAVKKSAPEKLVGAFYGYFMHVNNAAYTGHCAIARLLDSPYVDFFAAPKSYYRCQAGDVGGHLAAAQSVGRKKLWLDELDNRTHLAKGVEAGWESEGMHSTRTVFWREFAKNLSANTGFWWMDLGGGWFDDSEIMAEFARLRAANDLLATKPYESAADILVLVDDACITHMNISEDLRLGFMEDFLYELRSTGCISDLYLLSDLEELDLSKYKLIVFAYTFEMGEKQRKVVESLAKDKILLFNYAAGIISDGGVSLENTATLTGVTLTTLEKREYDFPTLAVCDENAKVLIRDEEGNTRIAQKDSVIVNTKPYLRATELRAITDLAGCHAYTPVGNIVYGDARFLAVFTGKEQGLDAPITMREQGSYRDLISEKSYEGATLSHPLAPKSAAFFLKK